MSDQIELQIEYPNGDTDTLLVSIVEADSDTLSGVAPAANVYRIEETPVFVDPNLELYFGDAIETQLLTDGTHRFVRVARRAEFRHYSCMLSQQFIDSPYLPEYLAAVVAARGIWERVIGGLLLVHVPLASEFDAEAELDRRISALRSGALRA